MENLTGKKYRAVNAKWVEHCKACIRISEYLESEQGSPCAMNYGQGTEVQVRIPAVVPRDGQRPHIPKESSEQVF